MLHSILVVSLPAGSLLASLRACLEPVLSTTCPYGIIEMRWELEYSGSLALLPLRGRCAAFLVDPTLLENYTDHHLSELLVDSLLLGLVISKTQSLHGSSSLSSKHFQGSFWASLVYTGFPTAHSRTPVSRASTRRSPKHGTIASRLIRQGQFRRNTSFGR